MGYKPPPIWVLAMYITPWKIQHFEAKSHGGGWFSWFSFSKQMICRWSSHSFSMGCIWANMKLMANQTLVFQQPRGNAARLSGVCRRPQGSLQRDQRQNHIHASHGVGKDVLKTRGFFFACSDGTFDYTKCCEKKGEKCFPKKVSHLKRWNWGLLQKSHVLGRQIFKFRFKKANFGIDLSFPSDFCQHIFPRHLGFSARKTPHHPPGCSTKWTQESGSTKWFMGLQRVTKRSRI